MPHLRRSNGSDSAVYQVNLNTGDGKAILTDKKYALAPLMINENTLVLAASPLFDSDQLEYWGVDLQSGKRLWRHTMSGQGHLMHTDAHATLQGIFVVQCRQEPDSCAWTSLDPKTGTATSSGNSSLGGISVHSTWDYNRLYLEGSFAFVAIDTLTGHQLYQWP